MLLRCTAKSWFEQNLEIKFLKVRDTGFVSIINYSFGFIYWFETKKLLMIEN